MMAPFKTVNLQVSANADVGSLATSGILTVFGVVSTQNYGDSIKWNDVYSQVSSLSSFWEESADIIPTVTNYLSTNNVQISALTVFGNSLLTQSLTAGAATGHLLTSDLFHNIPSEVILNTAVLGGNISYTKQANIINGRYAFRNDNSNSDLYWNGTQWNLELNQILAGYNTSSDITQNTWVNLFPLGLITTVSVNFEKYKYIDQLDYTLVTSNSGNWNSVYNTVSSLSASWSIDSQTLTFTPSSAELSITNGNIVSLSSLNDQEFAVAMAIALS